MLSSIRNKVITTAELSRELNIPASYIPKITKQLKEKKLLKRQRDRMEAICWKNDRKKFLLWTLLTVQSQQWQLADVWRRTDTVPEIIQIAARCIRCYWICRTLIITGWKCEISDIIQPGKDEYFGRFYVVIKLNLKDQTYECIYSHGT